MRSARSARKISAFVLIPSAAVPQHEDRRLHPGLGVNGGPAETMFMIHRLGNDHAEGITTLDMYNDGWLDIVSGAYWYQNPGPSGGDGRGISGVPSR